MTAEGWEVSWRVSSKIAESFSSPLVQDYANSNSSLMYVESLRNMGFSESQALPAHTTISVKELNACGRCSSGIFSGDRVFVNETCDSRHKLGFCEMRGITVLELNYSENSIRIDPQSEFAFINMPAYVQIDSTCQAHEGQVVQVKTNPGPKDSSLYVSVGKTSPLTASASSRGLWPKSQSYTMLHFQNASEKYNLTLQATATGQIPSFASTVILGTSDPCAKDACNPYEICVVSPDVFFHPQHHCSPANVPGLPRHLPGSKSLIKKHVQMGLVEIDECLEGLHNCDEHHICVDTLGSFSCTPTPLWHECKEGTARTQDECTSFSLVAALECETGIWAALGSTEDPAQCMHEVFKHETCRKRIFKWHANSTEKPGQCECEFSPSSNPQPILYEDQCTWKSGSGVHTYRMHVPLALHSELDCVGPEFKTLSQHAQSPWDCMHQMLATSECTQPFFKFVSGSVSHENCMCAVSHSMGQCQYEASRNVSTWKVSWDSCYDGHAFFFLSSLSENAMIRSKGVHLLSRNHAYRAMVLEGFSTDALVVYRVSDGAAVWADCQHVDDEIVANSTDFISTTVVQRETRESVLPRELNPVCQNLSECTDGYNWKCGVGRGIGACPEPTSSASILKLNSSELLMVGATDSKVLWRANPTSGTTKSLQNLPAHLLIMQSDGDLRLYSRNGSVLWSTNTSDGTEFLADLAATQFVGPDTPDQQRCLACPAGKYKEKVGGGLCVNCVAGRYSAAGASSCSECITLGVSTSGEGSSTCVECVPGTYKAFQQASLEKHCVASVTCSGSCFCDRRVPLRQGVIMLPYVAPTSKTSMSYTRECTWIISLLSDQCPFASPLKLTFEGAQVHEHVQVFACDDATCDERTTLAAGVTSCVDDPDWVDSENHTCTDYASKDWCRDGGHGPVYLKSNPRPSSPSHHTRWYGAEDYVTFSDYAVDGVDASQACCVCGKVTVFAGVGEFQSQSGVLQVEANSSVSHLLGTWTAGYTCLFCQPGSFSTNISSDACTACPADTYQPILGANASSLCFACPPHSQSVEGSSNITHCLCNAGYTGTHGGPCSACVKGTYKINNSSASCTLCGAGTYSPIVAANSSSVCVACPADTYQPIMGANASSLCLACPSHSQTVKGLFGGRRVRVRKIVGETDAKKAKMGPARFGRHLRVLGGRKDGRPCG